MVVFDILVFLPFDAKVFGSKELLMLVAVICVRSNLYFEGILVFVSLYYLYFYSCSLSLYFIRAYVALLFFV
jgi:hypothetical protein